MTDALLFEFAASMRRPVEALRNRGPGVLHRRSWSKRSLDFRDHPLRRPMPPADGCVRHNDLMVLRCVFEKPSHKPVPLTEVAR